MGIFSAIRALFGGNQDKAPEETPAMVSHGTSQIRERRQRNRINPKEGTRVMIVDDSPTIVAALRKFMRTANLETLEALDGEAGLDIIRQEKPDLVFLDVLMPKMDGFAVLRVMRRDPELKHIPVIMISGSEQAAEQYYADRIGADDFMKKPFSRFEVFARIESLLGEDGVPVRDEAR